ncbi:S-methyl-5-thioadenosine phosphorylase SCDLUD_001754 [Saccharomycodes ludwigii]|uniref:S-methyl-5-thioadenosine phosphorylase n=1 Tax=Saccharomycodes ludwigii TaxID=36035 RepID=UPI001E8AF562|nr:hypothetical protein SCDLUD_001754 [Saccharomycodes ludwigii]KAH3901968.1 hypothetical protein SCDLUD_001754 [Saccharomycodes ludwigii]
MTIKVPSIELAIIGGTGFYRLHTHSKLLELKQTIPVAKTPWGETSSPIEIYQVSNTNLHVAFLSRHGEDHQFPPTKVPFAANLSFLKHIGVKSILSFSSVGSLREEIKPGDFVLPDQIIDRTKGERLSSYFNEVGLVGHVSFGEPFSHDLQKFIIDNVNCVDFHVNGTLICMEGPQFSTRAESVMYKDAFKASIINMSVVPEAKLARELELPYQMCCMCTDYDSWRVHEDVVTIDEIKKTLHQNSVNSIKVVTQFIEALISNPPSFITTKNPYKGMTKRSISTKTSDEYITQDLKQKILYIFPDWFI